jgi:hypothetical protein
MNLAALAVPLPSSSIHLLVAAATGTSCCRKVMQQLSCDVAASETLFDDAAAAIRWAIHRRRAYRGHEDPFAVVTCVAWVTRAKLIVQGRGWDEARRARMAVEEQVPQEAFVWIASMTAEPQNELPNGDELADERGPTTRGRLPLLRVVP